MIWLVLFVLVAAILMYICAPLFRSEASGSNTEVIVNAYGDKIKELEQLIAEGDDDNAELIAAKTALQRKTLEATSDFSLGSSLPMKSVFIPLATVFVAATVLLYSQLGTPTLSAGNSETAQDLEGLSLDQLVVRLEANLKADPANANGWIYYARSLMTLGRHEEALSAYDRALALTNSDEKIVSERASAVRYMDQVQNNTQSGPTAEDVEAAAAMTADEQADMIQNMVDGLSAKLLENPDDQVAWVRLLNARNVLGQSEQAMVEIERMKAAFADQPDVIEKILRETGQNAP